jgi:uncharacterized protein YfiM (DUF2279 family)
MKKLLLASLVVVSPAFAHDHSAPAPTPVVVATQSCTDCWNGEDKRVHFGVSFIFGFAAVNQWPENKWKAFGVAMIPGVLKEVADIKGSGFSGKDLAADALGAATGVFLGGVMITHAKNQTVVSYAAKF